MSDTIAYGRTALGQIVYDLGFTELSDRYLARKHKMPIAKLRELRAKVRAAREAEAPQAEGAPMTAPTRAAVRWDAHFLRLALEHARMSKDPSTKVGALIVGPDREIRATGFNGLPRGIADTPERLNDRETKLELVVHAEMNAVCNAARVGVAVKGCTMYLSATDASGLVWGGPPCVRCAVEVMQAGITTIVSRPFKDVPSRWRDSIEKARALLVEAGIEYRELENVDHG